jgi:hypothetical protein
LVIANAVYTGTNSLLYEGLVALGMKYGMAAREDLGVELRLAETLASHMHNVVGTDGDGAV